MRRLTQVVFKLCALLLCISYFADAELVLVYTVQRHGARNVLPKNATLGEGDSNGGPILLPQGEVQCTEAGVGFRQRYIDATTCGAAGTCLLPPDSGTSYGVIGAAGVGFHNYNLKANSSGLVRTIMSAQSYMTGIFPPSYNASAPEDTPINLQIVPVVNSPDSNDYIIRGYTKCPAYEQRLADWFTTDEFKKMEADSQALRDSVGALVPSLNVSLANWWNVYDAFNVWRNYQVGSPMPPVSTDMYNQITDLANLLETTKMRSSLTGNLLGGALLSDVLQRMIAAVAATQGQAASSPIYTRVASVSSHYNTQLGLLAALNIDQQGATDDNIAWLHKIPELASVLAFELHRFPGSGAGEYHVRVVAQDGPAVNYTGVPLPCAVGGDSAEANLGPGACTWERFLGMAGNQALNGSSAWCSACQNTQVTACQVVQLQQQMADISAEGDGDDDSKGTVVALSVCLGIAALACVVLAVLLMRERASERRKASFII